MRFPEYGISVILDFFKYDTVDDFIENYSFEGIENCTLIIALNSLKLMKANLKDLYLLFYYNLNLCSTI